MGSGLVDLHLKSTHRDKLFTISRDSQTLGRGSPSRVSKASDVKSLLLLISY